MPEFSFLFSDNEVEDVDEDDHFGTEKENGAQVLNDCIRECFWWNQRPVFKGNIQIRGLVVVEKGDDGFVQSTHEGDNLAAINIGPVRNVRGVVPDLICDVSRRTGSIGEGQSFPEPMLCQNELLFQIEMHPINIPQYVTFGLNSV